MHIRCKRTLTKRLPLVPLARAHLCLKTRLTETARFVGALHNVHIHAMFGVCHSYAHAEVLQGTKPGAAGRGVPSGRRRPRGLHVR